MFNPAPPIHWTADYIARQECQIIHELARNSTGTVTAYRLLLGRCLLALHRNGDSPKLHQQVRMVRTCAHCPAQQLQVGFELQSDESQQVRLVLGQVLQALVAHSSALLSLVGENVSDRTK